MSIKPPGRFAAFAVCAALGVSAWAVADDIELAVASWGGALAFRVQGAGRPVVFLHGVGLNKNAWRAQENRFSAQRTTIACDLPGHGESPLPPEKPALSDYSAPLANLLDDLGHARADIVGHSFGGLAALDFALRFPERTRRLVVLNGVFRRSPEARRAALARAETLARNNPAEKANLAENALRRWFGRGDGPAAARAREWLLAANPAGYARAYRLFAESDSAFADRLQNLRAPTLFVTGADDPNSTPEMSRAMAALAPRGAARILPGQRHMAALESPEIVNPVLQKFLDSPDKEKTA